MESLANGFSPTETVANHWRIFGEWFLANCCVGKSLANGFSRTETLVNFGLIFRELFLAS